MRFHFTTRELTFIRATGDDLTVKHLHTGEACLPKSDGSEVCITGDQLAALLSQSAAAGLANPSPTPTANQFANPTPSAAPDPPSPTPPVISINGANPAHIHVGDTYNDLGATITGPQADLKRAIWIKTPPSPPSARNSNHLFNIIGRNDTLWCGTPKDRAPTSARGCTAVVRPSCDPVY